MKVLRKLLAGTIKYFRTPRRRNVYAVANGNYTGEFLVYMEEDGNNFCFLSLPDMIVRTIPKHDVYSGLEAGILHKVERLPEGVYSVCCEQYKACSESHGTDGDRPRNIPSKT